MKYILLVWALFFSVVGAEAETEILVLDAETIEQVGGKDWRGIVYACEPFCRFISIREGAEFNPVLTNEEIGKSQLKLISDKDPIYPHLIIMSPVFPFISQRLKNSDLVKQARANAIVPEYAKMSFVFGWNLAAGFRGYLVSSSSDTSVQSEMASAGMAFPLTTLDFGLMKGSPNKVWKFWLQHQLNIAMDMGGGYETADGQQVTVAFMEATYQMWSTHEGYKTGPRLVYLSQNYQLPENSITHFSTNQTSILLGWALRWRRFNFSLDTAVSSAIMDSQDFRSGPFEHTMYRLGLNYCSGNMSLIGFTFGLCGGAYQHMESQKASVATNVTVTNSSAIDRNTTGFTLMLRFGEDFYQ